MRMDIGNSNLYLFGEPVVSRNGYSQYFRYMPEEGRTNFTAAPYPAMGAATRAACKIYDVARKRPIRNKSLSYLELKFDVLRFFSSENDIFHFLLGDNHFDFLSQYKRRKNQKLIFTVHQPYRIWKEEHIELLNVLDGLITMCEPDATQFASRLPGVRVEAIEHGVDVDYWKERPMPTAAKKRVGYCGRHLRNADMFMRVARRAMAQRDDVEFHCLITQGGMTPEWEAFGREPNVRILGGLSQDQVLAFYQGLYLLMLPLNDTTANNAVVEALSCGVPVLTTRVGGIASYGGGEVYPAVENDDDDALYAHLCRLLDDPGQCEQLGAACRRYVESHLSWPLIVSRHLDFYERIAASPSP